MLPLRTLRQSLLVLGAASALGCAPRVAVPSTPPPAIAPPAPLVSAPDQYFMAGDVRIRYHDVGQGDPVVLIHGFTRSLDDWKGIGDSLALDHRVIAFDVRGFGKSTRLSDPARLGGEMAGDVVRLLDHLGIRRAHLAGHSMGAAIAAKVATRFPDRVASLSLVAGPFFEDSATTAQNMAGYAADIDQGRGMKRFLRWLFPALPDSMVHGFDAEVFASNRPATLSAAMRSFNALTVLPSSPPTIRVPTVVIVGAGDALLPQSRWVATWWPNARLVEIPEADHVSVLYHPRTLAAMRSTMGAAVAVGQ
jgi:pimeloyl-ACP methyl ester carboxylesterase